MDSRFRGNDGWGSGGFGEGGLLALGLADSLGGLVGGGARGEVEGVAGEHFADGAELDFRVVALPQVGTEEA